MDLQSFLNEHAISSEVGGNGRYLRWEEGDAAFVSSYYDPDDRRQQRHAATVAGQSSGTIISRVGYGRQIPPQLRPDAPVILNPARPWSFHPSDPEVKYGFYVNSKGKTSRIRALPTKGQIRERHMRKYDHSGIDLERPHQHEARGAKYTLPPGNALYSLALDAPDLDSILRADRVFFVIEGSLKTDAIRSQGEAAFGVPSVSLWRAPELEDFIRAMRLRSKQLVVVPDADWVANPQVILQAMMLRTYLRERGVQAVVAAPMLTEFERTVVKALPGCTPEKARSEDVALAAESLSLSVEVVTEHLQRVKAKKGVDDFLVENSLADLSVLEREPPDERVLYRDLQVTSFRQASQIINAAQMVSKLSLYADEHGQLPRNLKAFSKITGRGRNRCRETLEFLERAGFIEVEGDLSNADYQYVDKQTGEVHDYDWNRGYGDEDERPRITLVPEFRAVDQFVPLCDLPLVKREARSFGKTALFERV